MKRVPWPIQGLHGNGVVKGHEEILDFSNEEKVDYNSKEAGKLFKASL